MCDFCPNKRIHLKEYDLFYCWDCWYRCCCLTGLRMKAEYYATLDPSFAKSRMGIDVEETFKRLKEEEEHFREKPQHPKQSLEKSPATSSSH